MANVQFWKKRYDSTMSEGPTALPPQSAPGTRAISILDSYCRNSPSDQNAIDIFQGEWSSQFPPPYQHLKAGPVGLFQDIRLDWAIEKLGGVGGYSVLELGSLEGGHAYMLEHAGAAYVSAIEANTRAYLKCLIAKEILQLERTRFWCGNFIPFLESTDQRFDLIVAAGVLYHMTDPLKLLRLIAGHTDRLYLWTHYFDADAMVNQPNFKHRFQGKETVMVGETPVVLHHHFYRGGLKEKTYCGGIEVSSKWLSSEGIVAALREYGFQQIEFAFETLDHPNGPCMSLVATK